MSFELIAVLAISAAFQPVISRQLVANQQPLDLPRIDSLDLTGVVQSRLAGRR